MNVFGLISQLIIIETLRLTYHFPNTYTNVGSDIEQIKSIMVFQIRTLQLKHKHD